MNNRTKQAVDIVTAALKERLRQQRALVAVAKAQRELGRNESVPRKTKVAKHNTLNATTFQSCPGGARDEARTGAYAAFLKQVAHAETGCIVVEPETKKGAGTLRRLQNSALNANTTQGNYSHSIVQ